jgi:hypothetical protein
MRNDNYSIMKPKYLLFIGLIAVIFFFYFNRKQEKRIDKQTLKELDLQLTGVVDSVDKLNGYNGTGIIRLKILTSNIDNYDPRNKLEYYYCIIKNGIAELYDGNANECFKGDTLKINTKTKIISWMNKKKQEQKYSIWISTDDDFYKYAKSHQLMY